MSDLADRIAQLPLEQRLQIEKWLSTAEKPVSTQHIARRTESGPAPLSFGQERLWFLHQIHPSSTLYNQQFMISLGGWLKPNVLKAALTEVIRRHEILHTAYEMKEGQLVQTVVKDWELAFEMVDLTAMTSEERERAVKEIAERENDTPFDLSSGIVKRFVLLQTRADEYLLLQTSHHIATDLMSTHLLLKELSALYKAFSQGQPSPLPEPLLQYADYAIWQRRQIDTPKAQKQRAYWQQKLANPPTLTLPTDYRRPAVQSGRGTQVHVMLPANQAQQLYALARALNTTPYAAMLTLFNILIARFTGQTDFCIGTPGLGRPLNELMEMQGFFISNLILRTPFQQNDSFLDVLRSSRQTILEALEHQDYPFSQLVSELHLERDLSRNPLAQIRFAMNQSEAVSEDVDNLFYGPHSYAQKTRYDLHLRIVERDSELQALFSYNTDIFASELIEQMAQSFRVLLGAVIDQPDAPIVQLPLQVAATEAHIVSDWNATGADFSLDRCFPELFAEQALLNPGRMVAADQSGEFTWQVLQARADHLAAGLQANEIQAGDIVALLCRRETSFLAGLLAILQIGAVYLPLDPRDPPARHRQMVKQSGCRHLLAAQEFSAAAQSITQDSGGQMLIIEQMLAQKLDSGVVLPAIQPSDYAYLLYTSGSTGAPKGALVEHRGMLNHLFAKISDLELGRADRIAQTAPQSFDISIWQFLIALLCGGSVHIYPDEIALHPRSLLTQLQKDGITVLEVVPTLLRAILDELENNPPFPLPKLRWLIPTGEALPPELCNRWLALYPNIPLLNAYGPTECSDDVTHHIIRTPLPETALRTPIGRPIANMQAYILDEQRRICPVGLIGELWIGGVGVGPGYLNEPEQTAVAFHPDPFRTEPDARLYRTGDLARYRADGLIEFFGRTDHQVKIRGARVELDEIEAVLRTHPDVENGVVIYHKNEEQAEGMLLAFAVAVHGSRLDTEPLHLYLRNSLPEHMTPTRIELLDSLPVTPNGKVDRTRLVKERNLQQPSRNLIIAPRTPLERVLVEIWQRVLKQEKISIRDNFFNLGGDSIRAAIVINELQQALDEVIYVVALFDAPTIADLATYLQQHYAKAVEKYGGQSASDAQEDAKKERLTQKDVDHFRQLIPPLPAAQRARCRASTHQKNPPAIFILSSPRSGSTLFRVMLGGHSKLFAPPELDLLSFNTLAERQEALHGRFSFRLEGLLRALMELRGCQPEEAIQLMQEYESQQTTTAQFYGLLQEWIGQERLLVDKTPAYALDVETLKRAEIDFDNALYIHLLRHPAGMIHSFEEARTAQVFFRHEHPFSAQELAELTWLVSHQNILDFLSTVPPSRHYRLKFEDLVTQPRQIMQQISHFLGLSFEEAMWQPYQKQEGRMTDGIYAVSKMLGDVKFQTHRQIDARVANRWPPEMADSLSELTWQLAERLGYRKPGPQTNTAPTIKRAERSAYRMKRSASGKLIGAKKER